MKQAVWVKTQQEYDTLMKYLEERGGKWGAGKEPTEYNFWDDYEEDTCINVSDIKSISFAGKPFYLEINYQILTLEEYIGKPKFKVGDRVRVIKEVNGIPVGHILTVGKSEYSATWSFSSMQDESEVDTLWFFYRSQDDCFELLSNESTNSSKNKVGKIMSTLTKFVKDSLLSKEEKLLRKYGLKNDCGDYTSEAEALVMQKLLKDNEAYLIEVATAKQAEEKEEK